MVDSRAAAMLVLMSVLVVLLMVREFLSLKKVAAGAEGAAATVAEPYLSWRELGEPTLLQNFPYEAGSYSF